MPTFFSRRYMRGKPKSTEQGVGALVLALTGAIVAAFLLTGGLFAGSVENQPGLARAKTFFGISEKPLFTADPRNLPQPSPPREHRVGQVLLPESLGNDLPGGQAVHALSLRTPPDADAVAEAGVAPVFVEAARTMNARWLYARAYGPQESAPLRVQVLDLGDVDGAMNACESRKPAAARALTVGRGGWQTDSAAGFWSGRYYTEIAAAGSTAESLETVARALAGMQLAYGPFVDEPELTVADRQTAPRAAGRAAGAARFAEVTGSTLVAPTRIDRYAENLYEKINGKESAFRAFFIIDLKFGQYADPETRQTYDVYIYDMAAPANALGIYMSERVSEAEVLDVGRDGYVSGTSVFFWKGQYYVNVLGPPEGGEPELNSSRQIALTIAETIADAGEPFWAEALLPAEGRVPHSFSYQATSALGYEFLQRMYFARYEVGGRKLQMFISRAADPAAAKSIYERFADSTASYDKVLSREELDGGALFISETPMPGRPSKFGAGFFKGSYFGGVYDGEDHDITVSQARAFFESLSANDPGDAEAGSTNATGSTGDTDDTDESAEDPYGQDGSSGGESSEDSSEGGESGYY